MTRPFSISCICQIIHGQGETHDQIIRRYSKGPYGNDYDHRLTKTFPYQNWKGYNQDLQAKYFEFVIEQWVGEHINGRLTVNGEVEEEPLPALYEIMYESGT